MHATLLWGGGGWVGGDGSVHLGLLCLYGLMTAWGVSRVKCWHQTFQTQYQGPGCSKRCFPIPEHAFSPRKGKCSDSHELMPSNCDLGEDS